MKLYMGLLDLHVISLIVLNYVASSLRDRLAGCRGMVTVSVSILTPVTHLLYSLRFCLRPIAGFGLGKDCTGGSGTV